MLVNRNNLAVKDIALKEGQTTRYVLTGVYFTPKGTVASDGYILVRVECPKDDEEEFPHIPGFLPADGKFEPVLVPREGVDQVLTAHKKVVSKKKEKTIPILGTIRVGHETNGQIPFAISNLEVSQVISVHKLDEMTPDYDRVMPEDKPVFSIAMDAERLLKVLKVLNAMDLYDGKALTLHFYGPERAVYITGKTKDEQKVEALVMPLAVETGIEYEKPEAWMADDDEDVDKEQVAEEPETAQGAVEEEELEEEVQAEGLPERPYPPDPGVVTTPYIPETVGGNSQPTSSLPQAPSYDMGHGECDICGARAPLTKVVDGDEELWLCPECVIEFDEVAQVAVS